MNCSHCQKPLHRAHLNKEKDLDICVNPDCSVYRRPQGTVPADNTKLFKPHKENQSGALLDRFHHQRVTRTGRYAETQ